MQTTCQSGILIWSHHHCNLQDPRSHQWHQQVDIWLGPRDKHWQNKQLSLLNFHPKEQIKLRPKDEIVPQTDTPTFPGVKLDTRLTWKPQINSFLTAALKIDYTQWLLLLLFSVRANTMSKLKRNVPLSKTTVRMGQSSVIYYYWKNWHCLTFCIANHRGGNLIYICIVRK